MSYYQSKAISNSVLSYINPEQDGSAHKFYQWKMGELESDESPSLERGDLIHKYKLEPDLYDVMSVKMPTESIKNIIDDVLIHADGYDLSEMTDAILASAEQRDYGQSWKPETLIKKVVEGGQEYFDAVQAATGKQIISHETKYVLDNATESLDHNKAASELLDTPSNNDVLYFNELEVFFEINGMATRAKLDRLIVNTVNKTFTVVDLKSTSKHVARYAGAFEYYRTYRQLAFYIKAAQAHLGPDYKPAEEHYIVACMTTSPFLTRVFNVKTTSKYIEQGNQEIESLLSRIKVHTDSSNWIDEMETILGQTKFELIHPEDQ